MAEGEKEQRRGHSKTRWDLKWVCRDTSASEILGDVVVYGAWVNHEHLSMTPILSAALGSSGCRAREVGSAVWKI